MSATEYKIVPYNDTHREQLLGVWERSVVATHAFLNEADFVEIKEIVRTIDFNALPVYCLVKGDTVTGFIGVADRKIEMLFLDPDYIGLGLGKKLMGFAVHELQADKVDVNEQNINAAAFYRKFGFEPYERTEKDDQGKAYPLLRMQLTKVETFK